MWLHVGVELPRVIRSAIAGGEAAAVLCKLLDLRTVVGLCRCFGEGAAQAGAHSDVDPLVLVCEALITCIVWRQHVLPAHLGVAREWHRQKDTKDMKLCCAQRGSTMRL